MKNRLYKESQANSIYFEENKKINLLKAEDDISKIVKNTKFDEYFELLDIISSGSHGKVYKSKFRKINTNKFAACKFIIPKNKENRNLRIFQTFMDTIRFKAELALQWSMKSLEIFKTLNTIY